MGRGFPGGKNRPRGLSLIVVDDEFILNIYFITFFSERNSPLSARACQSITGLTSTLPHTEVNDDPANLGVSMVST